MYHHCDGYPSGVGTELSDILSDYEGDWDGEDVRKFINAQEEDYQLIDHGVVWDQEYVYIIDCARKTLSGYYKGITSPEHVDFDLEYPGDELLIPSNKFSTDKPTEHEKPTSDPSNRQHVYFFMADEDGNLITDIWTCSVPDIGEQVIIWNKEGFKHYTLKNRIYGANADEKVGCWNLYVAPMNPSKKDV
jgi:hypothetical protein